MNKTQPAKIPQPVIKIEKFDSGLPRHPDYKRRRFYFRLVAANGEILSQSESYTTKAKRDKTVKLIAKARMEVV